MKSRFVVIAGLGLFALGCDALNTGITIVKVIPNSNEFKAGEPLKCGFVTGNTRALAYTVFDASLGKSFQLPHEWRNQLKEGEIPFGEGERGVEIRIPHEITPLRMDVQWHCDNVGFQLDKPQLIIPAFDTTTPFCVERDSGGKIVRGMDVVEAFGDPVEAGGAGIVVANVISHTLGTALSDTFAIGALADECCQLSAAANNNGICSGYTGGNDACTALERRFADLGIQETVKSANPTSPSDTLKKYRPLAQFNGSYLTDQYPSIWESTPTTPQFIMSYRTVMEGITSAGDVVVSGQFKQSVGVCHSCGVPIANTRQRAPYLDANNGCYIE